MNSRFKRLIYGFGAIIVSTAGLSLPKNVQGQTSAYIVTDLSNDDATQVPSKLNNLGDLVGRGARDGVLAQVQATMWNHSSLTKKHLGAFAGGDYSSATGINDYGEVTGASNIGTGIVPFVWTVGGSFVDTQV